MLVRKEALNECFTSYPRYVPIVMTTPNYRDCIADVKLNAPISKSLTEQNEMLQSPFGYGQLYPNLMYPLISPNNIGTVILIKTSISLADNYLISDVMKETVKKLKLEEVASMLIGNEQENVTHERTTSYMKRNVYKSIVRAMFRYVKIYRAEIIKDLMANNFDQLSINQAFMEISLLNRKDAIWKNQKNSQAALINMVSIRKPCTYILRETIRKMVEEWKKGSIGRISKKNMGIYMEVYKDFYAKASKTLGYIA